RPLLALAASRLSGARLDHAKRLGRHVRVRVESLAVFLLRARRERAEVDGPSECRGRATAGDLRALAWVEPKLAERGDGVRAETDAHRAVIDRALDPDGRERRERDDLVEPRGPPEEQRVERTYPVGARMPRVECRVHHEARGKLAVADLAPRELSD